MIAAIKRSTGIALWFIFLTFPLMVVKVNTLKGTVEWRWLNILWVGLGAFVLSFVWRWALQRRQYHSRKQEQADQSGLAPSLLQRLLEEPALYRPALGGLILVAAAFPWLVDAYQANIMVLALIFVVLGLGLNITVGLAGLLDLGYIAFFAVGAYTYALANQYLGLGFWTCLPLGGLLGALFGVLLGFPILRLRGDYLAIVTLGFPHRRPGRRGGHTQGTDRTRSQGDAGRVDRSAAEGRRPGRRRWQRGRGHPAPHAGPR
jgi:branched-chain amino acid transport system permease protein